MRPAADMQCRVIIAGFDPIDFRELHDVQGAAALDDETLGFAGKAQAFLCALKDARETLIVEGLEQIVESAHFEGAQGKLVVSGNEDNGKRQGRADALE